MIRSSFQSFTPRCENFYDQSYNNSILIMIFYKTWDYNFAIPQLLGVFNLKVNRFVKVTPQLLVVFNRNEKDFMAYKIRRQFYKTQNYDLPTPIY